MRTPPRMSCEIEPEGIDVQNQRRTAIGWVQSAVQALSILTIALLATAATVATVLAIAGVIPWLNMPVTIGETTYAFGGIVIQSVLTLILLSLCFFIPSSLRVLRLERSHRDFSISMSDVAEAYAVCHRADREGVFQMSAEFDSVKERIKFLANHPELPELEHSVIEAAAEMSHTSRDLAEVYSDEKVARARNFLTQRQEEVERTQKQIAEAHSTAAELKRWYDSVDLDEATVRSQIQQLEERLSEILPDLGIEKSPQDSKQDSKPRVYAVAAE